jgi:hypothetical protein
MPKQFYTEKDIEDLFNSGTNSLQVTEDVVLTELAYEKAKRLGFQLITDRADTPPAAPVRPYLSEGHTAPSKPVAAPVAATMSQPVHTSTAFGQQTPVLRSQRPDVLSGAREEAIEQRIRSAVIAKLGNQVDTKLLDNIIHRVVKGIGLK